MLLRIELVINGNLNAIKTVDSFALADKQIAAYKSYLASVLSRNDTWEIATYIKSDFQTKRNGR